MKKLIICNMHSIANKPIALHCKHCLFLENLQVRFNNHNFKSNNEVVAIWIESKRWIVSHVIQDDIEEPPNQIWILELKSKKIKLKSELAAHWSSRRVKHRKLSNYSEQVCEWIRGINRPNGRNRLKNMPRFCVLS